MLYVCGIKSNFFGSFFLLRYNNRELNELYRDYIIIINKKVIFLFLLIFWLLKDKIIMN